MQPANALGPITPLPLPPSATHAVLFGGSFDPPHLAHTRIPARIRDRRFGPGAWLIYTPAARSPFKDGGPEAPDHHRLAMLELATKGLERSRIWPDEINRALQAGPGGGPSYTIDTVQRARAVVPGPVKLALLIGSDQAALFHRWRKPREILDLAEPLVMLRPPHTRADEVVDAVRAASFWSPRELERWGAAIEPEPVIEISSSLLRAQLNAGDAGAALMLDPAVLDYIRANSLYGATQDA